MQNMKIVIPTMENIKKTAEIFGLSEHFVRAKVSSGEVVAVRAGKRFLVNVEKFAEYLNTTTITPQNNAIASSAMPKIEIWKDYLNERK